MTGAWLFALGVHLATKTTDVPASASSTAGSGETQGRRFSTRKTTST